MGSAPLPSCQVTTQARAGAFAAGIVSRTGTAWRVGPSAAPNAGPQPSAKGPRSTELTSETGFISDGKITGGAYQEWTARRDLGERRCDSRADGSERGDRR